ncbi:MAG: HTTM domain-containing protein [Deltaproteobacteria bacterium]|nr:HTTM domain-containing protein [Deltaproteobacteria bacterium]MBP7289875.1 HTTM domain-containing protein [Nannocystaceae bacterium]
MTIAALLGVAGVIALIVVVVLLRERWQQWWFECEDPRQIARFRVVFALLLLCNVNGLHEWFELLFEPSGMFTAAQARAAFGAADEGAVAALGALLRGNFSVLHYWDDAYAFTVVLVVFELATVLFMVGLCTRVAGLITLVAFEMILWRNRVFWEGTEVVFRVFLVYLVCSRCGEAFAVDAWLRRRRGVQGPPALVPAWPRRLMLVQLCIIMTTTGLLKHDGAWLRGDAVYYALSYEHYTRFRITGLLARIPPEAMAAVTFTARSIETLFSLALVGVIGSWSEARFTRLQGTQRTAVVVAWWVALACAAGVALVTGEPRLVPVDSPVLAAAALLVTVGGSAWVWTRARPSAWRRVHDPRVWVGAAALLFSAMWLLMNIGWFHPVMLATLLVFTRCGPPHHATLAYSPRVRALGGVLIAWHLVAIAATVHPKAAKFAAARMWMDATRTAQGWGMWATPPETNVFLKAVAFDASERAVELATDLHLAELRPPASLGYDRRWKIAEVLAKPRSQRFRSGHARWLCRTHPGTARIELRAVEYRIPTPAENRSLGGYDVDAVFRERATQRLLLDHACP